MEGRQTLPGLRNSLLAAAAGTPGPTAALALLDARVTLAPHGPAELRLVSKLRHRAFDSGWTPRRGACGGDGAVGSYSEYLWPSRGDETKAASSPPFEWLLDGQAAPQGQMLVVHVFAPEDARALGFFEVPLAGLTSPGEARALAAAPFTRYRGAAAAAPPQIDKACTLTMRCAWTPRNGCLQQFCDLAARTRDLCAELDGLSFSDALPPPASTQWLDVTGPYPPAPPQLGEQPEQRCHSLSIGRRRSTPGRHLGPPAGRAAQRASSLARRPGSSRALGPGAAERAAGALPASAGALQAARPARRAREDEALGEAGTLAALRRTYQTPLQAFRAFDTNGDGAIDAEEFRRGLVAVAAPQALAGGVALRLFDEADVDGLGFLSMGRMCDLLGVL